NIPFPGVRCVFWRAVSWRLASAWRGRAPPRRGESSPPLRRLRCHFALYEPRCRLVEGAWRGSPQTEENHRRRGCADIESRGRIHCHSRLPRSLLVEDRVTPANEDRKSV